MKADETNIALAFARLNRPDDTMPFEARLKAEGWKFYWLCLGGTNILSEIFEEAAERFNKLARKSGLDNFKGDTAEKRLLLMIKKTSTKEQYEQMIDLGKTIKNYWLD